MKKSTKKYIITIVYASALIGIIFVIALSYYRQGAAYTYYFEDKNLKKEKYQINKGRKDGSYEKYSVNGDLIIVGFYCDGVKCGNWREYHSSGKMKFEYNYDNSGNLGGDFLYYERDGTSIYRKESYKNGIPHGDWITYDRDALWEENEVVKYMITFENGEVIYDSREFQKDGG